MHQPENPARRTLLAQTVAGSAALALGSLLGGAPGVALTDILTGLYSSTAV
ncbi:hypothetical protein DZ918_031370, partial [Pseudomonas aeruginosa]|uniref:hypothetical protein n=1 Tax=Pseudomonas aeruginosa TaxID=287 RepID=UPI0015C53235